jgi:hypothetical protein
VNDAQLLRYSRHILLNELGDLFPGSLHVRLLDLAEADDLQIWN